MAKFFVYYYYSKQKGRDSARSGFLFTCSIFLLHDLVFLLHEQVFVCINKFLFDGQVFLFSWRSFFTAVKFFSGRW